MKFKETIEEKWKRLALSLRAEADKTPSGRAKDALLKQARQLDTASHMQEWLSSPGLRPPKGKNQSTSTAEQDPE